MVSESALAIKLRPLAEGDIRHSSVGDHLVLEAATGSLLQALRLQDGLLALRGGRVQTFQVARQLPAAFVVEYPDPFAASSQAERAQVVERARSLLGLNVQEVISRLTSTGIDEKEIVAGGEVLAAESLVSFCVTGTSRSWHITEVLKARRERQQIRLAEEVNPSSDFGTPSPELAVSNGVHQGNLVHKLKHKLQEKAISTAIHVGCRGPAARAAGAAAAMTVEGYALYKEIDHHRELLGKQTINNDQYTERICESTVSSSGRAIGSLAGAALGQASIPVPVVGAVIGGVVGGTCGGFHANSLIRGAMRLSGGKAKGGDDMVRCVDHGDGRESVDERRTQAEPATNVSALSPQARVSTVTHDIDDGDLL